MKKEEGEAEMDSGKIKQLVCSHRDFFRFAAKVYNHLMPGNRLRGKGVKLEYGVAVIKGLKIHSSGTDNKILLGDFVRINHCEIYIDGSHNRISIGDFGVLNQVTICMEDDCNAVTIGAHTSLCGKTELSAIEGTEIRIGDGCMFSSNLAFRTGDSHSVLDETGRRINPSQDIEIGDHVWIGTRVTCLKGVRVPKNCIVAATATLCGQYREENAVIAGVPAKVVKRGVSWCVDRLKMEDKPKPEEEHREL